MLIADLAGVMPACTAVYSSTPGQETKAVTPGFSTDPASAVAANVRRCIKSTCTCAGELIASEGHAYGSKFNDPEWQVREPPAAGCP